MSKDKPPLNHLQGWSDGCVDHWQTDEAAELMQVDIDKVHMLACMEA